MTMTSEGVKPFETSAVRCLKRLDTFRCDEREVPYENSWDLSRLYKAAAAAMEIAPDQHSEQVIKQILSGVTTVVTGLGALRNSLSDAHGRGQGAVRPAPRHAKLAVNARVTPVATCHRSTITTRGSQQVTGPGSSGRRPPTVEAA